jgi:hypothetical protein
MRQMTNGFENKVATVSRAVIHPSGAGVACSDWGGVVGWGAGVAFLPHPASRTMLRSKNKGMMNCFRMSGCL